ncbi:MAG: helix-turn-helix transcriptional regulator, partial [Flavobacteriaceae bacterium]|nr:helix-turn-helix transcriptional regulator [Flavobacteriaceae bacterium]
SSEKFSVEISKKLSYNYSYVSRVFSANTGLTIEKYLLKCKIDKVKELIRYQKFSIKEIAYLLDYTSLSHLSNHFKRETGITPSQFKKNISL